MTPKITAAKATGTAEIKTPLSDTMLLASLNIDMLAIRCKNRTMTNLKQARSEGKMDQFIAEREAEAARDGDPKAFNRTLEAMVRTSKSVPETSKLPRSAG